MRAVARLAVTAAAMATLATLALVACDGGHEAGGVLVVGFRNPWQPALQRPWTPGFGATVADTLREKLVREDGRLGLAASIAPDDGGQVWTVTLRDGARFASGRPITAGDVVASLAAHVPASTLSATVLGDGRVRLELPRPRTELTTVLARVGIARADQADDQHGAAIPLEELDASGSWKVARARAPDVVLVPNPYALVPPSLDGIVLRSLGSGRNVLAAAVAGEIDTMSFGTSVRDVDFVRDFSDLEVHEHAIQQLGVVRFNCRSPKLADARVRRALNLAVERQPIVTRFAARGARPAGGLAGVGALHDPAAAMRLLDEAGWRPGPDGIRARDGQRLELVFLMPPFFSDLMDVVQALGADLRAVGIDARVEAAPSGEVQARRVAGDFELTWTWYIVDPDAPAVVFSYFRPAGEPSGPYAGGWDFGGCAAVHEPWVLVLDRTHTPAGRAAALAGLTFTTTIDPPALFVFATPRASAMHPRFVSRPPSGQAQGSAWSELVLRAGQALPRDRISVWLGDE